MAQRTVTEMIEDRSVRIVSPSMPLHEARALLSGADADALVVLSETGPCGVLRQAMLDTSGLSDVEMPVAACMTLVGPAIPGNFSALQALRVMRSCGRNDLPVMDAVGRVISLISIADLLMVLDFDLCEDLVA